MSQMSMWKFKKNIAVIRREFMKSGDMQGYQKVIAECQPKEQVYMQLLQTCIFDTAGCPFQQFQATERELQSKADD